MKKIFALTARTKTQTLILEYPLTAEGLAAAIDELLQVQFETNETPEIEDIQTLNGRPFDD